eukprot:Rhum_TRINITY_DN14639_c11_g1::Rhum_TRINITY_DN14639_c11_g1_i2::g.106755::m.106755
MEGKGDHQAYFLKKRGLTLFPDSILGGGGIWYFFFKKYYFCSFFSSLTCFVLLRPLLALVTRVRQNGGRGGLRRHACQGVCHDALRRTTLPEQRVVVDDKLETVGRRNVLHGGRTPLEDHVHSVTSHLFKRRGSECDDVSLCPLRNSRNVLGNQRLLQNGVLDLAHPRRHTQAVDRNVVLPVRNLLEAQHRHPPGDVLRRHHLVHVLLQVDALVLAVRGGEQRERPEHVAVAPRHGVGKLVEERRRRRPFAGAGLALQDDDAAVRRRRNLGDDVVGHLLGCHAVHGDPRHDGRRDLLQHAARDGLLDAYPQLLLVLLVPRHHQLSLARRQLRERLAALHAANDLVGRACVLTPQQLVRQAAVLLRAGHRNRAAEAETDTGACSEQHAAELHRSLHCGGCFLQ